MAKKIFKYLHTMIRVKNLEESISFYSKIFEMKLLRKSTNILRKYSQNVRKQNEILKKLSKNMKETNEFIKKS